MFYFILYFLLLFGPLLIQLFTLASLFSIFVLYFFFQSDIRTFAPMCRRRRRRHVGVKWHNTPTTKATTTMTTTARTETKGRATTATTTAEAAATATE